MKQDTKTFHESWYRIADQRVCLKASCKIKRQLFRGSRWYVITDPSNNQFYRLTPASYEFISRLTMNKTVEEVWKEIMTHDPDNAPGQEDIINLLAQLYHANLLHYELSQDSAKLFERYKKRKQKILQSNLSNIMFFRIPLFDPDMLLKRLLPFARVIIGPIGAIIWGFMVIFGIKLAIDNFHELGVQSQGILAPSNLFLLYIGLVVVKTLHEFGHSFAVRRFGGEVHTMGIMFLIFTPIPYMDATAAWAFRSKWKRVLTGAAGMITEIFVGVCAIFVWANTGPGVLHSLMYNIVFVASVSTILFNINPLLRFDGYYILSDLLDIPNLHTQASQQLTHIVEKYAFGYKKSKSPAPTTKEKVLLTTFGILSGIYKVFVFTSILLFVADRFLLAGIIMAAICAALWVIAPVVRLVKYLATDAKLDRIRLRAVAICSGTALFSLLFLYVIPFPASSKAPGILKASEYAVVVNTMDGYVSKIVVPSGGRVKKGDTLIKLSNKELDFKISEEKAKLAEIQALRQKAMNDNFADLKPISSRISAADKSLKRLYRQKEALNVKAKIDGLWVSTDIQDRKGMWISRGTPLGQIINNETFYFASVVSQPEVSRIFSGEIRSSEVKLAGESAIPIHVKDYLKIPMEQTLLPSPALGWASGGDLAVDVKDGNGTKAAEPFFEIRAKIDGNTKAVLLHGRSGKIKFKLPNEPLLKQWWLKLRQLLQKRYQI